MADVYSNIQVNIDTTEALASLKNLQRQISAFHTSMAKGGAAANAVAGGMQQNLINSINATGKFQASFKTIQTSSESFNQALAKNQLSLGQYFRYAGGATQTFGKLFAQEHATINKVARENVKSLQTQYIKLGRDANGAMKAIAVRPLSLDMQNLGTQTAMAAQKQALLNQLLKQGSTNLINFGKNTQWAGRQLMVGFTVPLMYFGSVAGKTFMQLEEQAIRFKRVYGDMFTTTADTDKALKDIQNLANSFTQYGVAVADTMKMAADVAATGKVGADLTAQVASATKLAVLGGIDQQKALDTVISLTSTFGIAAGDLANNIDFLNAVENQTILNIDDLTTAIPKAAPVIKQLGGDVQDLAFFMTAMREGGINASEGANAIKSALASMINPTKAAKEMLSGFGINLSGIIDADKGNVKKMVLDLAMSLDKLDPLNRAQAIEKMFGKFQFSRISTLFQNVIKDGSQAQTVLGLTKATTEELAILSERELKKVSESPMYKFKKEVQDLKTSLAPIGGEFIKALTPVIKFFGGLFEHFNNLGDGTKKFVVLLTTVLAGIGPMLLMSFGLLANGVGNIIKLFSFMRGVFTGTGKTTKVLGEETAYMTQQQIEAAAVASSLDQAHQRLQQRFTSEAVAVNELAVAYERALAAQRLMTMPGMGRAGKMPGIKKYAEGIVVVPGKKGDGDVVPAMLSPGESVIPAKMTEKYAPLIQGMVADSIPGYDSGRVGSGSQGRVGKSITTVMRPYGANVANSGGLVGFTSINPKNSADLTSIYTREILQQSGVSAKAVITEIKKWETVNRIAIDQATAAVNAGASATTAFAPLVEKFRVDMQAAEGPFAKFAATARMMGPKLEADLIEAQAEATRLGLNMKSAADASALAARLPNNMVAQSMATPGAFGGLSRIRSGASAMFGGVKDIARAGIPRFMISPNSAPATPAYKAATSQEHFSTTLKQEEQAAKLRIQRAEVNGKKEAMAHNKGVKSAAQDPYVLSRDRNSPHALAGKDGMDDGKAYKSAMNSSVKAGGPTQAQMAATSRTALYGTGPVDAEAKSVRRQLQKEAMNQLAIDKKITQSKQRLYGTTEEITQDMRTQRRLAQSQARAIQVANAKRIAAEQEASMQTKKNGIIAQFLERRKQKALADRALAEEEGAIKAKMSFSGKMMGLSMVAMMGSMLPGQLGELSQKVMMATMAMGMLGQMKETLTTPLGAATAAILAIGIAVWKLRSEFDAARTATMKQVAATGASTEAIRKLSVSARTVTAGEQMDRRRADALKPLNVQSGKSTFGEQFVKSETGKNLYTNLTGMMTKDGQKIAGGTANASTALANQLMSAVTSGALTKAQADSIAANMAVKLGDVGMAVKIVAKLDKILGPNGENLLKDPIGVRLKVMKENEASSDKAMGELNKNKTRGFFAKKTSQIGTVALAAGAGAAVGAMVAGPVGAVAGAVIGAIGGYFANKSNSKKMAALAGAAVAEQTIALQQNKEQLDSLDLYYSKKVEELKLEGKITEAKAAQAKWDEGRNKLTKESAQFNQNIIDQFNQAGGNQEALLNGAKTAAADKWKGTDSAAFVEAAQNQIGTARKNGGLDSGQEYLLNLAISTGDLDPRMVFNILDPNNAETTKKTMEIYTKFGAGTTNQMANVAGMFVDLNGDPVEELKTKFIATVSAATSSTEANDIIALYGDIAKGGGVYNADVALTYIDAHPDVRKSLMEDFKAIDAATGKDLEIGVIYNIDEKLKGNIDEAYYKTLSDQDKKTYVKTILTELSIPPAKIKNSDSYQKWLKESGLHGGKDYLDYSDPKRIQKYVMDMGFDVTNAKDDSSAVPTGDGSQSKGTGPTASPLDDLLKKLKEVRKVQIKVTEGWSASKKALNDLFSGKKELKIFEGLDQQMRKRGAGEDLISFIAGMDPKEYEKRKNELFEFDKKGNILKLKTTALSVGKALQEISLGEFQNKQQKLIKDIGNQSTALNRLVASGMSVADAYSAVEDAAFAAAVANKKLTDEELKKITSEAKKAAAALKEFEAIKGLKNANDDFKDKIALIGKLGSKIGTYTNSQIQAIMQNKDLQTMLLNPKFDQKEFNTRLQQVLDESNVNIALNTLTIEGLDTIFSDGFNKAMEEISAKEQAINLKFNFDTKYLTNIKDGIIPVAERDIAKLQTQTDTYQTSLKEIEGQEKAITDSYDAKFKALDQIQKANDVISRQQKNQLGLANALSQGDIAAAAQAAQEMRAQNAADAIDQQRAGLDTAKQIALDNVKTKNGLTRKQTEAKIAEIEAQILDIEINRLKPAQEALRQAELTRDIALSNVTSLGKTKEEWESIKNGIDLAKTKSAEYQAAIQAALDVVKNIKKYWTDLDGKTIKTIHEITTTYTGGNAAGQTPTPPPAPPAPGANAGNIDTVNKTVNDQTKALTDAITAGTKPAASASSIANDMATALLANKDATAALGGTQGVLSSARYTGQAIQYAAQQAAEAKAAADALALSKAIAARRAEQGGYLSSGGLVPKYFAMGGYARGTDTVPAMLTPGEFIMSKYAVSSYGVDKMKAINNGDSFGDSVYNYSLTVNAKTDSNANEIARTVMAQIKQIDSQRVRGNKF